MLQYDEIKEKPREFLAATGLTDEEFQVLLPTFEKSYWTFFAEKAEENAQRKNNVREAAAESQN